ncbi:hypothetical protein DL96DRAFT_1592340 [Flagelloscypha sp. PMI_526]|nr:hypothetical protein DL96DRAFT_1592340 [Flagelloscypha sp. PMI_526]
MTNTHNLWALFRCLFTIVLTWNILLTPSLVYAQQYLGSPVNVSLTAITGSEIAFFRIQAPDSAFTLINYFSLPTATNQRPDPLKIQRLVVVLHGSNRNAWDYFSIFNGGIPPANALNPNVTTESVAVLAPWFANTDDKSKFSNGTGDVLLWDSFNWFGGDDSVSPSGASVSSFECLDQILLHFDDRRLYPNLKHIVVSGHSRGAQMVQRYAAIGKPLPLTLFLNSTRPFDPADCTDYDDWTEGLSNYTNAYEFDAVNEGPEFVQQRYSSRDIAYARGLNDHGDQSDDCKPVSQGVDRGERLYNFIRQYPPDEGDTVDYIAGVGHNSINMVASDSGIYRLFLDDFDGEGHRHADIGERQVPGLDNPHPIE